MLKDDTLVTLSYGRRIEPPLCKAGPVKELLERKRELAVVEELLGTPQWRPGNRGWHRGRQNFAGSGSLPTSARAWLRGPERSWWPTRGGLATVRAATWRCRSRRARIVTRRTSRCGGEAVPRKICRSFGRRHVLCHFARTVLASRQSHRPLDRCCWRLTTRTGPTSPRCAG